MRTVQHFAAVAAAIAVAALSPGARADEAPPLGISFNGYLAPAWDSSVTITATTNGQSERRSRMMLGFATVANLGPYAVGGVVDGFPGIFGWGRMTVGGVAGWQPQIDRHRYQVLAELGAERFSDVGGTFFATPSTHETWLKYVGARLGASETFGRGVHFELGGWLFVRKDLGEATVSNRDSGIFASDPTNLTVYKLGGTTAGAALCIGFGFDRGHFAVVEPVEVAADL